jgi:hypothetical protein
MDMSSTAASPASIGVPGLRVGAPLHAYGGLLTAIARLRAGTVPERQNDAV